MIEGLKLRVTSSELRLHCEARSRYHTERAAVKEKELPGLEEAMQKLEQFTAPTSLSNMSKGGYALDPESAVDQLKTDIKDHRNKALVFDFFAAHLFDEDYNLQENDLVRLEILKR